MKKKLLIGLLTIIMCFVVVGCGNDNTETNNEETNNNTEETNTSNTSSEKEIELYSDSTKIVFQQANSKLVFYYSGDKITKYEAYLDYETSAAANYALSVIEQNDDIKRAYTNGRYVVVEYNESVYEDMTASEVRTLYSYLKEVQKN